MTPNIARNLWTADPGLVEAFHARLREAFAAAARRAGGVVERSYEVAGQGLQVRFAGNALVPSLTPALAHLETRPAPRASLTISAWDSMSTGVAMPPPPWGRDADLPLGPLGQVRGTDTGRIRMAWEPEAGVFSLLDFPTASAIFRVVDAGHTRPADIGAPFRTILHWWMGAGGHQLAHAGAVGTDAGAVLLAGRGGSGKTTTALACLRGGLRYLADDYCLLEVDPEPPRVWSLYATAKLDGDGLRRFPDLADAVVGPGGSTGDKTPLLLASRWLDRLMVTAPVQVILLPHVTGGPISRLRPATRAESLRAFAPSTMFQLAGGTREAFTRVSAIVRQLPAFVLGLGDDLSAIPGLVAACLDERRASAIR